MARTSWKRFAGRRPDGELAHFFHSTAQVKMCGDDPRVLVELTLDPNGPYWGWLHSDHRDNGSWRGEISMVFAFREAVEICFPYGSRVEVERGHGEIVRLRATVLREAQSSEGIVDNEPVCIESGQQVRRETDEELRARLADLIPKGGHYGADDLGNAVGSRLDDLAVSFGTRRRLSTVGVNRRA